MGRRRDLTIVVELLAAGATVTDAASRAGVGRATLKRRLTEPAFRAAIAASRAQMLERAAAQLAGLADKAIATLGEALDSADGDAVRLRAAVAVLDKLLQWRQVTELEARIIALEQQRADIAEEAKPDPESWPAAARRGA